MNEKQRPNNNSILVNFLYVKHSGPNELQYLINENGLLQL